MWTELDQARLDHERAKRRVRRLHEQRQRQRCAQLDNLYFDAMARVRQTLLRLEALERATPPGGDGSRQQTQSTTQAQEANP